MSKPRGKDAPVNNRVDDLVLKLADVNMRLTQLTQRLTEDLTQAERAGVLAHIASLTQRRKWYVGRIRARKPVQSMDVLVGEHVTVGERV